MELGIILTILGTISLVVGIVLCISARPKGIKGTIHITYDDPNGPGMFLRLDVPIEDIVSEKQVVFNVKMLK